MEGMSPSVVLVPAQSKSRRLAAKSFDSFAEDVGNCSGFVWAKRRRKVVASGLHRPPVSRARTTSLHLCAPWICERPGALLPRIGRHVFGAGWMKSKGIPRWCRPRVAPPPHNGSPLAITSILLSSCRLMWSRLRSLRRVLVVTLAPASRQTLAAALLGVQADLTLHCVCASISFPSKETENNRNETSNFGNRLSLFTFARPSQRLRSCKGHGVTQLYKTKWARQNCT